MKYSENVSRNREEFSVGMTADHDRQLRRHLLRSDKQEDVAFALYKPSPGKNRFTALLHQVVLPYHHERTRHGPHIELMPGFHKRVCGMAIAAKSGIAMLHSHPTAGWQGMSAADISTENRYALTAGDLTDLPFVGMTIGTDGTWSARVWEYQNGTYQSKWVATVRVIGMSLAVSFNESLRARPQFKEKFKRTVTVWGQKNHSHLARLRIGIIGLGSVGSIVAESLARMGMQRFVLIDFDEVQEHNLDRLLGATEIDIGQGKIYLAERQMKKASTADRIEIRTVPFGVTEEEGYLQALDCDVLFSCVDRPWPRMIVNNLAYNHLIPVIDGGIKVRLNKQTHVFEGADWQLQTVGPTKPCLQCLDAYNSSDAMTEQEGKLDDPHYIEGLPDDHTFKRNENIFPFSANLASLEVMQFIEMVTGIGNTDSFGVQRFSYNEGQIRHLDDKTCQEGCLFQEYIATGDTIFEPQIGFDHSAAAARMRQANL
jgi:molybdopterin/thiamine biosynthesis adenylyltransferase